MKFIRKLGPGLLYAGAAIGVSHLVQSTTAGARFGLTLIWAVVIANILKFPIFEFGVRYANIKKESLIEGYRTLGLWAIILFIVITVGTMFTIQAAVTIVTAGLFEEVFNLGWNNAQWSILLIVISGLILAIGRFRLLDKLIKFIIVLLSLTTLTTLVVALINVPSLQWGQFSFSNSLHIGFLVALIGWMPAPFDVSVWQSIWVVEKMKLEKGQISFKEAMFDFKLGYWGAAGLALSFLLLGALIMFGSGEDISPKGAVFARQIINIFTSNLGEWSYPLVAIAALTTMFSTTLTCLDAFPRVLSEIGKREYISDKKQYIKYSYWIWMAIVGIGAVIIISFLASNMGQMVKLATIISFLTAPAIAIMNYQLVFNKDFPEEDKPKPMLKYLSWIGIVFLSGFGVYYIYLIIT